MHTFGLLAGPNDAGKATLINRFLRQRAEALSVREPGRGDVILSFRHPPASRDFAAQTGGPSGLREQDPVADTGV